MKIQDSVYLPPPKEKKQLVPAIQPLILVYYIIIRESFLILVKFKWWKLENNPDGTCIPFQRYGHTAVTLGTKVYLWGGRNDKEVCNTLYCFDTGNSSYLLIIME